MKQNLVLSVEGVKRQEGEGLGHHKALCQQGFARMDVRAGLLAGVQAMREGPPLPNKGWDNNALSGIIPVHIHS